MVGTPILAITSLADALSAICRMVAPAGPMKVIPAASHCAENVGFSTDPSLGESGAPRCATCFDDSWPVEEPACLNIDHLICFLKE